jgi:hypothetical protein
MSLKKWRGLTLVLCGIVSGWLLNVANKRSIDSRECKIAALWQRQHNLYSASA